MPRFNTGLKIVSLKQLKYLCRLNHCLSIIHCCNIFQNFMGLHSWIGISRIRHGCTVGVFIQRCSQNQCVRIYFMHFVRWIINYNHCRAHGFPNNLETYGLISGLWTSTFALGAFIGPSISGILYDNIGFRNASMFIVVTHLLVGFIISLFVICNKRPPTYVELKDEKTANGDVDTGVRTAQNSVTESMKRFDFNKFSNFKDHSLCNYICSCFVDWN